MKWFQKAAAQGKVSSPGSISARSMNIGRGVKTDYKEALRLFRLAAEKKNPTAELSIGSMSERGLGVPQDYKEAATWYRRASDHGNADAQYDLALMYAAGHGVPQDYKQAAAWYRKAADQGNVSAQLNLGALYFDGQGVPKAPKDALKYFRMAAQAGADAHNSISQRSTPMARRVSRRTCRAPSSGSTPRALLLPAMIQKSPTKTRQSRGRQDDARADPRRPGDRPQVQGRRLQSLRLSTGFFLFSDSAVQHSHRPYLTCAWPQLSLEPVSPLLT